MKRLLSRLLAVALLLSYLSFGASARSETMEGYFGVWVADGVAVEIWREEGDPQCRVVFMGDDGESDVWAYGSGWYDEAEGALQFGGVTRTHESFDTLWNTLVERDWSMNDLSFARFDLLESGLLFSDDGMDETIALTRLGEAGEGERTDALAFVGRWQNEASTLRVEDHGVAYLFTVTVPMDADRTCKCTYTCRYDAAERRMVSVDVSYRSVITRTSEGGTIEEEVGRDYSEAVFVLEDGNRLVWIDVTDGDGEDMAFERIAD